MPAPPARIVVIAIDAASPTLVRRWAAEGALPHTRDLIARGLAGPTAGIEGFFVGSTWPSFYTGVTPARHGCHYLLQLKPGTYELYDVAREGIARHEPFWAPLGRAGRRVAVLDVPLTRLDPPVNGMQVVEWGSHDAIYGFQASPVAAGGAIRALFGAHPLGPSCDGLRTTAPEYERLVRALIDGARVKGDLTRHFLRQGGWDLFIQVFSEAHCAGHQCWHLHDAAHVRHDRRIAARVGDPLRRVYESIDGALGAIVRDAGDALVVLLIAHGMSHECGAHFLLRDLLCALGVATADASRAEAASPAKRHARRVWRRLPAGVRRAAARLRGSAPASRPSIGVDPDASLCFPHRNGHPVSGIRLNLVGREPRGRLKPDDAAAFCDRLRRDLLEIVEERTGRPLVRRVLQTRDLYDGEFLHDLPDLLVEWDDEAGTGTWPVRIRATSPRIGVVEGTSNWNRTGDHRPEGMFVAAGPGIGPGGIERPVSLLDFAPTLSLLLGVEWRGGDGQPIAELLQAARGAGAR